MTFLLAEEDLTVKGQIHFENGLVATIVACLLGIVILIALTVWLSKPSSRPSRNDDHGRHAPSEKSVWHQRIEDIVSRHAAGELEREEAFTLLAATVRDFVSSVTGTDMSNRTLTDIQAMPRTTGNQQNLTLLRQTIEAFYPPEFADAEHNRIAKDATVEQAGEWVAHLVERWR